MLRKLVLIAAVGALGTTTAVAQKEPQQFSIGPRVGYIKYADNTALNETAMLGLNGVYYLNSNIGIGFMLDIARPQTDGDFFPAEMSFGDTTFIFKITQPVTVVQFGLQLELTTGGSFAPFVSGSVGGYRVSTDPQVGAAEDLEEFGFSIGGGFDISTGGGTAIRLEVRDFVFTDFDRDILYPVRGDFQPSRFPELVPLPDPFTGSAQNIHVALAFTFTPGG